MWLTLILILLSPVSWGEFAVKRTFSGLLSRAGGESSSEFFDWPLGTGLARGASHESPFRPPPPPRANQGSPQWEKKAW